MKVTGEIPINPGLLRHRLRFFRPQKSKNAIGGDVITPILVATVHGQIQAMTGFELERAMALYARAKYKVSCHFFPNCNREFLLEWNSGDGIVMLDILDVQDTAGTRARLELLCADPLAR